MAKFELLTYSDPRKVKGITRISSNPKIAKGEAKGYLTFILHLAPARLSGFNVCPKATQGCAAGCLNTAGRGGIPNDGAAGLLTPESITAGRTNPIQRARIRKTRFFFQDRAGFMSALVRDLTKAERFAKRHKLIPAFRLNGTSDIRWERIGFRASDGERFANLMSRFPDTQFYDYTKLANRKDLPGNYHLTFSLADGNDGDAIEALHNDMPVAAVFRDKATVARYVRQGFALSLPRAKWKTRAWSGKVVDGDETDLRFLDPPGVIVALYAKGNARRDTSGFVRD